MTISSRQQSLAVPESLAEAQALLAQLQNQLSQNESQLIAREQQIYALELKNQKLAHELAYLKRLRYSAKSESMAVEQKALFEDDVEQDLAAITAELGPTRRRCAKAARSRRPSTIACTSGAR